MLFSRGFGTGGVFRSDLVQAPRRLTGLLGIRAVDERGGLPAGYRDTDGYAIVVCDTRAGRTPWRDRRWESVDVSADGRLLLGWSRPDGWAVREAPTGVVRHVLGVPRELRIHGWAWEDSRHLLAD